MQLFFRLLSGYLAQLVPFAALCAFPFRKDWRFSRRKTALLTTALILGTALVFAVSGVIFSFIFPADNALFTRANNVFLLCLIPCFLWYLYAIKAIWQKKLFVFSFALTSALLSASICECILREFSLYENFSFLPYNTWHVVALIGIVYIIVSISLCLFLHYFYLPVEDGLGKRETGYLAFLSLFLFFILGFLYTRINFYYVVASRTMLLLFFTLLFTVFLLYGVMFKMYALAYAKQIAHEKYLSSQYQLNIRDEQYRRILGSIEHNRKQRHDLRHHLLTLQGLWENGETQKARDYLSRYLSDTDSYHVEKFCSNPVINMLVSHYSSIAEERGVKLTVHIHIPDSLSIQDMDLSVLMGNLLENALDAADCAPDAYRYIHLNMLCRGKMVVITIDNGFSGITQKEEERYLSTKPEHQGLGLQILHEIAEKYGGGAEFSHDDMTFHSSVMLREL